MVRLAIYLTSKLAPELLGAIAVAAYSYMALVPLIQPPIMKALTTEEERKIRMTQMRHVSNREKSLVPGDFAVARWFTPTGCCPITRDVLFR